MALVILELDRKSNTPPTALSSYLKEASPIPTMIKSSFGPILENFNFDYLSLAFLKTFEIYLRSFILAELFFFDIASAV